MAMVEDLSGDQAYNLDRRGHSLQAATRAMRDGADEELIVVALLHDIGESLGPMNHGEIAASSPAPICFERSRLQSAQVSRGLSDLLLRTGISGSIPNARDQFKHEPWYQMTADFCAKFDEVSFDPIIADDSDQHLARW